MLTIIGLGITPRMVTNMLTRVVPLTGTALGITRTCTIGIVGLFTVAAITAAMATPIKNHRGVDLISDVRPFGQLWYDEPNAVCNAVPCSTAYELKAKG